MAIPDECSPEEPWIPYSALPPTLEPADTDFVDESNFRRLSLDPNNVFAEAHDFPRFQDNSPLDGD